MTAFEFVRSFDHLPWEFNGNLPVKPSNSAIKRWMENGSILINGKKPKPLDEIEFPVWQFIFFPKNQKRRTTYQDL